VTRRPILTSASGAALLLGATLTACSALPGSSGTGSETQQLTSSSAAATTSSTASSTASPSGSETPDESLPPFACSLPVHGTATTPRAQITDLRVGTHSGYDRIVFSFATGIPEYVVEKAVPPLTKDSSGLPVQVEGTSYLRIVLHGGTIQLPDGGQSYSGATSFTPHFPKLVDLQSSGDFEAVASWYAGTNADACVRAFTLTAPDRLVIDLQP
jgi:hypothetical protein